MPALTWPDSASGGGRRGSLALFALLHGYLVPVDINLAPLGNRLLANQVPVACISLMYLW
jgi:hypothetical protein